MGPNAGLLLINLGTPGAPNPKAVGPYLREFLMDEEVLDVPAPLRWLLVNVLIVPKRKIKSAEAYEQVWTDRGSPLLWNTVDFQNALQKSLDGHPVELGMRYGAPTFFEALKRLKSQPIDELYVAPLYPQYATSSTRTALTHLQKNLSNLDWNLPVKILKPFYGHPEFISAFAKVTEEVLQGFGADHVLFSYHGLPKRHITRLNPTCFTAGCCDRLGENANTCYRFQCYQTSRLLTEKLKLDPGQTTTSFQSRLGPGWIQPFTDHVLRDLPKKGVRRLAVVCPSFVADCLETLEEIQVRGREIFTAAGGEELKLVPSLNGHSTWVSGFSKMIADPHVWEPLKKPALLSRA